MNSLAFSVAVAGLMTHSHAAVNRGKHRVGLGFAPLAKLTGRHRQITFEHDLRGGRNDLREEETPAGARPKGTARPPQIPMTMLRTSSPTDSARCKGNPGIFAED